MVKDTCLLGRIPRFPFFGCKCGMFGAMGVYLGISMFFEMDYQGLNVQCLLNVLVVPVIEEQTENPLGKFIIIGIASFHLSVPIVAKTHDIQLLSEAFYVLFGSNSGMLAGLDGVLFGGQTEGVVTHWVQNVVVI